MIAIIKPTLDCNLNCSYCYFKGMHDIKKMTLQTYENILVRLNGVYIDKFIWHGGEPLLMGIQFFKTAISLQEKYGLKIQNNIQSNLTLLNDDWISFFREYNIKISTSLDGTKEVHNRGRSDSFDRTISAIRNLHDAGIKVGCVTVIHDYTLPHLYEIFGLFQSEGITSRFNPETCVTGNVDSKTTEVQNFGFALRFLADLWLTKRDRGMQPFNEITDAIRTKIPHACIFSGRCVGEYPSILPGGDVVHCGRFVGSGYAEYGNVNDLNFSFDKNKNNKLNTLFIANTERVSKCESCEFFKICNGGCFYHGWMNGLQKDGFCEAYKAVFRHILTRQRQMGGYYCN